MKTSTEIQHEMSGDILEIVENWIEVLLVKAVI